MFKGRKNCGSKHSFAVNFKYCQNEMNKNRVTWLNSRESVFQTQWKLNKYPNPSRDLYYITLSRCSLDVRLLPFRILKSVSNAEGNTRHRRGACRRSGAQCWDLKDMLREHVTTAGVLHGIFHSLLCGSQPVQLHSWKTKLLCCLPHNER